MGKPPTQLVCVGACVETACQTIWGVGGGGGWGEESTHKHKPKHIPAESANEMRKTRGLRDGGHTSYILPYHMTSYHIEYLGFDLPRMDTPFVSLPLLASCPIPLQGAGRPAHDRMVLHRLQPVSLAQSRCREETQYALNLNQKRWISCWPYSAVPLSYQDGSKLGRLPGGDAMRAPCSKHHTKYHEHRKSGGNLDYVR